MPVRLNYHFEPKKGWINDPNGLIFYQGLYHAFFQYNPYEPKWGPMHWGHAVSTDLIHWKELAIALYPDKEYENSGGCFSGSAVEKDGILYLFYTSVSKELGQTQSAALSKDGVIFQKYKGNPVIQQYPIDGSNEFRDPKVVEINGTYYMVCGSGKDGVGKILFFQSDDLLVWNYQGVLFESTEYGPVLECPDLFPLGGKYVLMFSKMGLQTYSTQFIIGEFDGKHFTETSRCTPEAGPQFYAPQTFCDARGRRIMIGWLSDWSKPVDKGADFAGALTIPRELSLKNDCILNFPVEEALPLLTHQDKAVKISRTGLCINDDFTFACPSPIKDVSILRDTKSIEIFINGGEHSYTYWFTT